MVSEDSQHLRWLPMVHRLHDLRDLDETGHREVPTENEEVDDLGELGEVSSLRRSQRVSLEERNDHASQLGQSIDRVRSEMLPMVVVAAVDVDVPAAEEPSHLLEHVATRLTLDDGELRAHLPSELHRALSIDGATEAAFPIYETHQPCGGEEPFLLIFRTLCIVTDVHVTTLHTGYDTNDE